MARGLDYMHNGEVYRFNLNTFSSEIYPQGRPNGLSLSEAIGEYFDFSEVTKYCKNCHYSKKFNVYILPLENQLGEKNFIMIKNDKVFNPNGFAGFCIGDEISEQPLFISSFSNLGKNNNWIYFSEPHKAIVDFVIKKYKINPEFQNNQGGQLFCLLSAIPNSWNYQNNNILLVSNPTVEDRTVLINLLQEEDFIEFENEIIINLNTNNIDLLANHCVTLYSILQ